MKSQSRKEAQAQKEAKRHEAYLKAQALKPLYLALLIREAKKAIEWEGFKSQRAKAEAPKYRNSFPISKMKYEAFKFYSKPKALHIEAPEESPKGGRIEEAQGQALGQGKEAMKAPCKPWEAYEGQASRPPCLPSGNLIECHNSQGNEGKEREGALKGQSPQNEGPERLSSLL